MLDQTEEHEDQTPAAGDNSELIIDADELDEILSGLTDAKKNVSEANGVLRNKINATIKGKGWNKTALSIVRQIDDKSDTERADILRSLMPMIAARMGSKWERAIADMLEGDDGEGEE